MITLAEILEALTQHKILNASQVISEAVIDSRQVIPASLFVAMPGEKVDGHRYVEEAFRREASLALVQQDMPAHLRVVDVRAGDGLPDTLPELPFCLRVDDTLKALQDIARFWRRQLQVKALGITGSVGKSTTKEIVFSVLSQRYRTLKNAGNLNNEIGLPLTMLRLGRGHERAILEMGFYVPGEIAFLCDLALPTMGVVTNVGMVHAERAGSQDEIARGKSELVQALPEDGTAILNYDDLRVRAMAEKTRAKVLFYGLDPAAHLWADDVQGLGLDGIRFKLHTRSEVFDLRVPMVGVHSVHAALRAAAVGLADGLSWEEIITGLQQAHSQLRLVAVHSASGALILDDTYNAAPESMVAALNLLSEINGRKVAVLGDMYELGQYEKYGHEMVGRRAAEVCNELLAVGQNGKMIAEAALAAGLLPASVTWVPTVPEAITYLKERLGAGDVALIKGGHSLRMDRVVSALEVPA